MLVRDPEPALWAHTQQYTGPDGVTRTRRGFFCRVRIEPYGPGRVRPHERTHPGPKEDRLRLTRATRANISPIFSLYSDPDQAAWAALSPATSRPPWAEITDGDGTVHRIWRVSDPAVIAAVQAATAPAELLIADGHHRYETMQAYAEERDSEVGAPTEPRHPPPLLDDYLYTVIFYNEAPVSVEPPTFMEMKITETSPGVRGDTASGRVMKPALLECGAKIQVPIFIEQDEKIKVDTRTGEYVSRVSS